MAHPRAAEAPTGFVALAFTDVQGSTRIWQRHEPAMREALPLHDRVQREVLAACGGYEVKTEGDAFVVAFARVDDALGYATSLQLRLNEAPWPPALSEASDARTEEGFRGLRVRVGIHVGRPECRVDPTTGRMDYFGTDVNLAARVGAAGHGGQILLSGAALEALSHLPDHLVVEELGRHRLKGLDGETRLVQVLPRALAARTFDAPKTVAVGHDRPFVGLRAFDEGDADLFFGREADVARVARLLASSPTVMVLGPSGAGKSSLLAVGLPAAAPDRALAMLRPGSDPIASLVSALRPVVAPWVGGGLLAEVARHQPERFGGWMSSFVGDTGRRLLLVVDQAEELFTVCGDPRLQATFAACLASAGAVDGIAVVVGIREDFAGRWVSLDAFRHHPPAAVVVGAPGAEGLRAALDGPIGVFGYGAEPGLAEELVGAIAREPAALALLQVVGEALWERRDRVNRLLTLSSWRVLGGVGAALAERADRVLAGMDDAGRREIRRQLLRMVSRDATRAPVRVEDLLTSAPDRRLAEACLARLTTGRLVQVREGGDGPFAELVHDSLIARWEVLARWCVEEREGRDRLESLRAAAGEWERQGRPRGLLWRDEALDEVTGWIRRTAVLLSAREAAFVAASQSRARAAARAQWGLLGAALVALTAGSIVAAVGWRGAVSAREQADLARADAERQRDEARAAGLRTRALSADPREAVALTWAAGALGAEVGDELVRRVDPLRERWLVSAQAELGNWSLSGDGAVAASETSDGRVVAWDLVRGTARLALRCGRWARVRSVLSPSGRFLATACHDGAFDVFDTTSGAHVARIPRPRGVLLRAAFAADERWLVVFGPRSPLTRVALEGGGGVTPLPAEDVLDAVPLPAGGLLALFRDHAAVLDAATGAERCRTEAVSFPGAFVAAPAPGGAWVAVEGGLAAVAADCSVRPIAGADVGDLRAFGTSADHERLVVVGRDVVYVDRGTGRAAVLVEGAGWVVAGLDGLGRVVVSELEAGTTRRFDPSGGSVEHASEVTLAVGPRGTLVWGEGTPRWRPTGGPEVPLPVVGELENATAHPARGVMAVWSARTLLLTAPTTGAVARTLSPPALGASPPEGRPPTRFLEFSPSGRFLVASSDGETVLYDLDGGGDHRLAGATYDVAWAPDERVFVRFAADLAAPELCSAPTAEPIAELGPDGVEWTAHGEFTADGARVVVARLDGEVSSWDAASGAPVDVSPVGGRLHDVAVLGRYVVVRDLDRGPAVLSLDGLDVLGRAAGVTKGEHLLALGDRVLSGTFDGRVVAWDVPELGPAQEARLSEGGVAGVYPAGDGRHAITFGQRVDLVDATPSVARSWEAVGFAGLVGDGMLVVHADGVAWSPVEARAGPDELAMRVAVRVCADDLAAVPARGPGPWASVEACADRARGPGP